MTDLSGLTDLVEEIKAASRNLADADARTDGRLEQIENPSTRAANEQRRLELRHEP